MFCSHSSFSFHLFVILTFCEKSHHPPPPLVSSLFKSCFQATLVRGRKQWQCLHLLLYLCLCLQQACSQPSPLLSSPNHPKLFISNLTYFMISLGLLVKVVLSPLLLIFHFRVMLLHLSSRERAVHCCVL